MNRPGTRHRFRNQTLAGKIANMTNRGVYPLDPDSQTGLFRQQLGDVVATPLDPDEPGFADYEYISDAAIAALLQAFPTMPDMAMSRALSSMAIQMIAAAQDIQVDDIRIKTVERAELMLRAAESLAGSANGQINDTGFTVVPLVAASNGWPSYHVQGQPRPVGESGF